MRRRGARCSVCGALCTLQFAPCTMHPAPCTLHRVAFRRSVPTDFTLPELGEQIESGDVLRVLVKPGETITKDQAVLELETDKATIEVPSSVAGKIKEIKVKVGDKVKVGQAILSVEDGADGAKPAAAKDSSAKPAVAAAAKSGGEGEKPEGAPKQER